MNDMKCPFCQQELDYLAEDIYGGMYCPNCKKHDLFGNEKMWQELIRTRKALEIAVDALKRIKFRGEHSKYECCKVSGIIAQGALDKITALEQKD